MRIPPIPVLPLAKKRQSLLPATTVTCPWPINLAPGDEPLFQNAVMARLPPVQMRKVHSVKIVPDLGPCYWIGAIREAQFRPPRLHTHVRRAMAYWTTRADTLVLDDPFWITDALCGNYYHWLMHALPKICLVCKLFGQCNVLLQQQYETIDFVRQSLQAFPEANIVYLHEKNSFSAPHLSLMSQADQPQVIWELRSRILQYSCAFTTANEDFQRAGKVYINRTKQTKRRIVNESGLSESIQSLGYQSVFMEELEFTEQVRLMNNTQMLLGAHGAGLTNMLFMPRGSTVIEIRREADALNNIFYWLASVLGHRYYYLPAKCVPLERDKSEYLADDLVVDVPRLLKILIQADREQLQ